MAKPGLVIKKVIPVMMRKMLTYPVIPGVDPKKMATLERQMSGNVLIPAGNLRRPLLVTRMQSTNQQVGPPGGSHQHLYSNRSLC